MARNKAPGLWLQVLLPFSKPLLCLTSIPHFTKKETKMHYKTIVLSLLMQHREMHENLRRTRKLLSTVELYAKVLKTNHEAWKKRLQEARPSSSENQTANEALEIAINELVNSFHLGPPPDESDPPSIEGLMAFILSNSRRA
jgi:hypothetical protein